jgi:hypothetical protein
MVKRLSLVMMRMDSTRNTQVLVATESELVQDILNEQNEEHLRLVRNMILLVQQQCLSFMMLSNSALQNHLAKHYEKHGEVAVSGEAFNRSLARPGDKKDEVKFVHTSYSTKGMGKQGSFIIHSKMPTNQQHDPEHFKNNLSDDNIKFDHDIIKHTPSHVDVKDEVADFHKLNHELINSRTVPKNKEAKLAEIEKFNNIKKRVSAKVSAHLGEKKIKNKFGSGTEGLVVHPSPANPEATRFKAINPKFKEAKSSSTLSFGKK